MYHKTDIRLVDTHSECISTYHHPDLPFLPFRLSVTPGFLAKAGMIEGGIDAVGCQKCRKFFRLFSAADIDNTGTFNFRADIYELSGLILATPYDIRQIRTFKTALYQTFLSEAKTFHYIICNLWSSCCGKCYHGSIHELAQVTYLQIIRTEIITPL